MLERIASWAANADQSTFVDAVMKVVHGAMNGEELAQTAASALLLVSTGLFARGVARTYTKYFSWSNKSFYWATRAAVKAGGTAGFFSLPIGFVETVIAPVYALIAAFTPRSAEARKALEQEVVTLAKTVERLRIAEDRLGRLNKSKDEAQRKLEAQDKTLAEVSKVVAQIDPVKFKQLLELEAKVRGQAVAQSAPVAKKVEAAKPAPVGWVGKATIQELLKS